MLAAQSGDLQQKTRLVIGAGTTCQTVLWTRIRVRYPHDANKRGLQRKKWNFRCHLREEIATVGRKIFERRLLFIVIDTPQPPQCVEDSYGTGTHGNKVDFLHSLFVGLEFMSKSRLICLFKHSQKFLEVVGLL